MNALVKVLLKALLPGILLSVTALAHKSYTGGYAGAPGQSTCASSCHATAAGTITVTGFPSSYIPGQSYTITIGHTGGSKIINVNAVTRIGSTANSAGIFSAGSNSAIYSGGGIYAGTHLVDQVVFQWIAPAAGIGSVTMYIAGMQGTSNNSSSGQTTKLSITAVEGSVSQVSDMNVIKKFSVLQNYPNPFNPSTKIHFTLPARSDVRVAIYDLQGREIARITEGVMAEGDHEIEWTARASSGIYVLWLEASATENPTIRFFDAKKIALVK